MRWVALTLPMIVGSGFAGKRRGYILVCELRDAVSPVF
jgi:hypothetical protein